MPKRHLATIVLADDDAQTFGDLSEALFGEGFDVLPAASAEDAMRLCRTGEPDLAIVDLAMPEE